MAIAVIHLAIFLYIFLFYYFLLLANPIHYNGRSKWIFWLLQLDNNSKRNHKFQFIGQVETVETETSSRPSLHNLTDLYDPSSNEALNKSHVAALAQTLILNES